MIDDDDIDANCWIFDNAVDTKLLKDDSNTDTYNLVKNIPDNMDVCTFDKKNCESSFEWPLKEGQEYVEFKKATLKQNVDGTLKDIVVDACIPTNSLMKTVCDSNNIPYNKDTGICDITQDYCMQKGADWLYDNEIKDYDCGIDAGQEFGEALLGTTITRGLKQIFDPRQYESCKADETDDGYFCRKTKDCKTGEREALPLYKEWIDEFDLRNPKYLEMLAIVISKKDQNNHAEITALIQRVSWWFRKIGLDFK
jgi:hypothetical protein